jgi:hypothetical protein
MPIVTLLPDYSGKLNLTLTCPLCRFQEHILCPRTIFFGHQTVMMECTTEFRDEWFGNMQSQYAGWDKARALGRFLKLPVPTTTTSTEVKELLTSWEELIVNYRMRRLTKAEDRIIAFAGTARAIHNITRMVYIAGTWVQCLPMGLLWYVKQDDCACSQGRPGCNVVAEPAPRNVPSWSWFSIAIEPHTSLVHWSSEHSFISSDRTSSRATLTSFRWPLRSRNELPSSSYYDFHGLQITMSMLVVPTTLEWSYDSGQDTWYVNLVDQISREGYSLSKFRYRHDSLGPASRGDKEVLLGLLAEARTLRYVGRFEYSIAGLVLVAGSESGTWRRIGIWTMTLIVQTDRATTSEIATSVFEQQPGARREEITLV